MVLSDLTVRNFKQEDLEHVTGLYRSLSSKSSHFIRDESFLRYFMNSEGVAEEGVFVVEVADEITGFAIVSISEEMGLRQGKILELQVKDASSMRALIERTLKYCQNNDVDSIVVVPTHLGFADAILKDWIKFETGVMMTKMISIPSALQALLSDQKIRDSYANKRIVFDFGDDLVEAKITPDSVEVSRLDKKPEEADTLVSLSPKILQKIAFRGANPYLACLTGRLVITPLRHTFLILKLMNMIKIATPLHVSLVDRV